MLFGRSGGGGSQLEWNQLMLYRARNFMADVGRFGGKVGLGNLSSGQSCPELDRDDLPLIINLSRSI